MNEEPYFKKLKVLGNLYLYECLNFPSTFACIDINENIYLIICINGVQETNWYGVMINEDILSKVKNRIISISQCYNNRLIPHFVIRQNKNYDSFQIDFGGYELVKDIEFSKFSI